MITVSNDVKLLLTSIDFLKREIQSNQEKIANYIDKISAAFSSEISQLLTEDQKQLLSCPSYDYYNPEKLSGTILSNLGRCFNISDDGELKIEGAIIVIVRKEELQECGCSQEQQLLARVESINRTIKSLGIIRCDGIGKEDGAGYFMLSLSKK